MGKKKSSGNIPTLSDIGRYIYGKIILPTCFVNTLIVFCIMLVSDRNAITTDKALLVLAFSFCIALSNLWFGAKQMSILLRTTLHFISITVSFIIIMLFGSGNFSNNTSGSLMILMVLVVLYLLVAPVPVYLMHKKEATEKEAAEYHNIYKR